MRHHPPPAWPTLSLPHYHWANSSLRETHSPTAFCFPKRSKAGKGGTWTTGSKPRGKSSHIAHTLDRASTGRTRNVYGTNGARQGPVAAQKGWYPAEVLYVCVGCFLLSLPSCSARKVVEYHCFQNQQFSNLKTKNATNHVSCTFVQRTPGGGGRPPSPRYVLTPPPPPQIQNSLSLSEMFSRGFILMRGFDLWYVLPPPLALPSLLPKSSSKLPRLFPTTNRLNITTKSHRVSAR